MVPDDLRLQVHELTTHRELDERLAEIRVLLDAACADLAALSAAHAEHVASSHAIARADDREEEEAEPPEPPEETAADLPPEAPPRPSHPFMRRYPRGEE
jgi:hypothetical protein